MTFDRSRIYTAENAGEARIKAYNAESRKIEKWKFRCPRKFSLEYLGIERKTEQ